MPLSEFHRTVGKSQIESTQSKMSDSTSFMPENDFVELLWENGPIVMQGQSNRQKKSSYPIPFSGHNLKIQEKGKFGQFEAIDSSVNELSPAVPCANIGLNPQDDDIAPWMNYPIEDPLCSEFFSELARIHPNPNPRSMVKDFNNVSSEPSKAKTSQSSVVNNSKPSSNLVSSSKPLNASNSFGLMNFSHFSRPVSIARANNESLDRLKEKMPSATVSTNPMESTLMKSNSVLDLHKAKAKGNKVISREDASRDKNGKSLEHRVNHQSPSFGARAAVGRNEIEKNPEPVVASSSVCSGNSAGAASNDLKHGMKRKNREVEESGYQSEDIDDESTGLKKPAAGRGSAGAKRRRAAEVHNLSERRRRDRINEKMRSLQELIPNCNKVDKASMLDEAIEYLKTLQLQVQMISMGSGLCMPPMMLPPGMQHMQGPPMAHFSPMGVGMGMGMGLGYHGMGMLDMNGFPMIPVSSMHTSQFHCPSIPGMPGSTGLQLLGMPRPGQAMPVSLPHAPPLFSPLSGLPPKGNSNANPVQVLDAGRSNLDAATKTSKNESQVTKESIEQTHLVQMGKSGTEC